MNWIRSSCSCIINVKYKNLLNLSSHSSMEPEPSLLYLLSVCEPLEEIGNSNVEQNDLYVSLLDFMEFEASEPLSAEMKKDEF